MDGVPYPQPLAGPEPQYMPWRVLLVRPIGHPPRPVPPRAADQRSRVYPTLLRVLRWGRYGHRGGPQTPEVGSLACVSRGPFSSRPPFRCVVCGGWCPVSPGWGGVWGGGGSLFLAVLLVCVSPPPLVVVRRRCVCLWRGACARGVCVGVWFVVCGVWCAAVVCWWDCGWCVVWLVPRHSWRRFLCATPRHSWLGFAAGGGVGLPANPGWGPPVVVVCFAGGGVLCCVCLWCVWVWAVAVLCCVLRVCGVCFFGGVVWWCGGCVFGVPFSLILVCVCALCGPSCWCGWRGGGGGSCAVWLPCVCVCVLAVCGWWGGVCHTLAGSRRRSPAWFKKQKKRSCRCLAEMRGMRDA